MIAWVYSGGGANGAFSVGATKELLRKGIKPDIIAGCSQGALDGMMVAQGMEDELDIVWRNINPDMITGKPYKVNVPSVIKAILKKSKGVLSNKPLRKLVEKYADLEKLKMPFYINAYDWYTHSYKSFLANDLDSNEDYIDLIMASTAMPLVWAPVYYKDMCLFDGGLTRNIPIMDLYDHKDQIDEMIVISCNPIEKFRNGEGDDNLIKIAKELANAFLFGVIKSNMNDLNKFDCKKLVIAPESKIGSNIDFNNKTVMDRYIIGQIVTRNLLNSYE